MSHCTLGNEVFLKLGQELQIEQVISCQSLLTNHRLHGLNVLADGVTCVLYKNTNRQFQNGMLNVCVVRQDDRAWTHKLVGDIRVVSAGHPLPDGRFHQTRERRQHVDGRIDLNHKDTRWLMVNEQVLKSTCTVFYPTTYRVKCSAPHSIWTPEEINWI